MKKFIIFIIMFVMYIANTNACIFFPKNGPFEFNGINYRTVEDNCFVTGWRRVSQRLIIPKYAERCECPKIYKVVMMEPYAFTNCRTLKSVELPSTLEEIKEGAFEKCTNLEEIWPGTGLKKIGPYAFKDCSSLSDVFLPSTIEAIGGFAFYGCSSLTDVKFSEYMNDSLKTIGYRAFGKCSSLTKIRIPEGVITIPTELFVDCTSLTSVELPNTLGDIFSSAFLRCSSLSEITIPNNVWEIKESAFKGCSSLTTITLSSKLKNLGGNVWSNCPNITTVVCTGDIPAKADPSIFDNIVYTNATLWVPEGTKEMYSTTSPWSRFRNIKEGDHAGIDEVYMDDPTIDYSQSYEIYNLSGIQINRDIDSLSPGVYIIRQGTIVKKIVIK